MRKEDKNQIISELSDKFAKYNNIYITDVASLTVEKSNNLRRLCFAKGIEIQVAKNTLIRKAMEQTADKDFEPLYDTLKGSTALIFSETGNLPGKVIKDFRKGSEKPVVKGAYIDSAIFIGDNQLDALANIKSKFELIGDVIGLLQSPAKNVISALQSGGGKLAGILKTLSERESN
jgi:large subunit ribosomal protein L10